MNRSVLRRLFVGLTFLLFSTLVCFNISAQVVPDTSSVKQIPDSTQKKIKLHSPRKAALLSAVLPGLGQAYNKKYWKIPVIYVGLGLSIYSSYFNYYHFQLYKDAFIRVNDSTYQKLNPNGWAEQSERFSNSMEEYRYYRDISYAITAAIYFLNIIDATVDAHLFYFDISDDLSLRVTPFTMPVKDYAIGKHVPVNGLSFTFTFF